MSENIDLFKFWIEQGWRFRLSHNKHMKTHVPEYRSRLKHEFNIIVEKEFVDYFMIVSDMIRWAKRNGIAVGPGRGSSAGSLVCYLLRITEVDPMQFPMLFERFLDPTRTDPPDIDIDFEDDRRDEVFEYMANKYGKEKVGNIASYTRYLGKNSLDDVARVYRIPNWKVEAVKSKLIERAEGHPRFSKSIEDTKDSFDDVAKAFQETPELKNAVRLEGNLRSFGVHAAGMVVSSQPLHELVATYQREIGASGRVGQAIPYDKRDAAYLGLLKIDALSLITMGEIGGICRMAGMDLEELYRIPLDDNDTLQAFRDGDVMGIFQFEGVTTRRILKAVQPTTFMHLSDVNALSRPGADDRQYIENKNYRSDMAQMDEEYLHPIMRQHLSWTYGVVVYEEQILMILRDLGGFEPKELNRMRKIIHDKLGSTSFNEYRDRFVKGAALHGLSEDTARSIWDGMVSASGYAFNIAHSVSYAHIGYWQQWLKIHYPSRFYTRKLSKVSDEVKRGKFIQEATRHGISVEPPNIQLSQQDWTLTENKIIAGFSAIDGIGPKTAANIIEWRTELFASGPEYPLEWEDLTEVKGIGKKTISKIIDFVESDDPFGVFADQRKLDKVRKSTATLGIPTPTHISIDIPPERELVCYAGILRRKKYYDAIEAYLKKHTDATVDEALENIRDNHLLKYAALDVEDDHGEIVKVWVWRSIFPTFQKMIQNAKKDTDVVVVQGYSDTFSGISIGAKELYVIKEDQL